MLIYHKKKTLKEERIFIITKERKWSKKHDRKFNAKKNKLGKMFALIPCRINKKNQIK